MAACLQLSISAITVQFNHAAQATSIGSSLSLAPLQTNTTDCNQTICCTAASSGCVRSRPQHDYTPQHNCQTHLCWAATPGLMAACLGCCLMFLRAATAAVASPGGIPLLCLGLATYPTNSTCLTSLSRAGGTMRGGCRICIGAGKEKSDSSLACTEPGTALSARRHRCTGHQCNAVRSDGMSALDACAWPSEWA